MIAIWSAIVVQMYAVPDLDCKVSTWAEWSPACPTLYSQNGACVGGATQMRDRELLRMNSGKGKACPKFLRQDRPCKAVPCIGKGPSVLCGGVAGVRHTGKEGVLRGARGGGAAYCFHPEQDIAFPCNPCLNTTVDKNCPTARPFKTFCFLVGGGRVKGMRVGSSQSQRAIAAYSDDVETTNLESAPLGTQTALNAPAEPLHKRFGPPWAVGRPASRTSI